jgi:hypothetical protein
MTQYRNFKSRAYPLNDFDALGPVEHFRSSCILLDPIQIN